MDLEYLKTFWGNRMDHLKTFRWRRLVPKFRSQRYEYGSAGVEFTRRVGWGVGLGLGIVDIWFGWPKDEENA